MSGVLCDKLNQLMPHRHGDIMRAAHELTVRNAMKVIVYILFSLLILVMPCHSVAGSDTSEKGNNMSFGMQVVMTAVPEKGEELGSLMLEASELVSTLQGCKLYVVQLSSSEKDTVLITEVWESKEDHKASLSLPEIQELIGKARPLISGMVHHAGNPLGGHGI